MLEPGSFFTPTWDGWAVATPKLSLVGIVDWMPTRAFRVAWALSQHGSLRAAGQPTL